VHHATSGNLDHRGIGDIDTLTVREYRALSSADPVVHQSMASCGGRSSVSRIARRFQP
jgi:hypothetical protein